MFEDRFAGQGSYKYNLSATAGTHLPKFPSWPEDQLRHAEYVAVFPNVLLGIQADHAFAMMIDPIAPEQTIENYASITLVMSHLTLNMMHAVKQL